MGASLLAASAASASPSVNVASPLDETVGRPVVHVEATCDDGGAPCTVISLIEQVNGGERRTGLGTWHDVTHVAMDVPVPDGAFVDLELHATDAAGTSTVVQRRVYGDTSPALHPVISVDGAITDADLARVLYAVDGEVWIAHRDGCAHEHVGPGAAQALTPRGALIAMCSGGACTLGEWRDGALVDRGAVAPSSLHVAGAFAVWSEGYAPGPLHRLDLASGADVVIAADATPDSGAVGTTGAVTYSVAGDGGTHVAHRWAAGVDLTLGPGRLSATDGEIAIFSDDDAPSCALRLYDGASNFVGEKLSPQCTSPAYLATVRDGWVAFVRPDAAGARQLFTRNPAGAITQLTTTGCNLAPPLAPDGTTLAWTTIDGDDGRWIIAAGAAPRFVTHSQPHLIRHVDGHWLVAIGRTLFSVDDDLTCACNAVPSPTPDSGSGAASDPAESADTGDAMAGGCNAGGGSAAPWLIAIAGLFLARRRRTARAS